MLEDRLSASLGAHCWSGDGFGVSSTSLGRWDWVAPRGGGWWTRLPETKSYREMVGDRL